jgi:hypothetical protein
MGIYRTTEVIIILKTVAQLAFSYMAQTINTIIAFENKNKPNAENVVIFAMSVRPSLLI